MSPTVTGTRRSEGDAPFFCSRTQTEGWDDWDLPETLLDFLEVASPPGAPPSGGGGGEDWEVEA